MRQFIVVSSKPYRGYQIELRDAGRNGCRVIVHPPVSRGAPTEVPHGEATSTVADLLTRAKAMIDAVMGPRPTPRARYHGDH